jgi:crotonobetainyl-CoA:carnitine CoA-transferase CaiB-like acyl-CoA transferase
MHKNGINAQRVMNSKEVSTSEHFLQRGNVHFIDDPTFGDVFSQGPVFMASETPPRHKWAFKPVGADNEYILSKLCGFSKSKIKELESQDVI